MNFSSCMNGWAFNRQRTIPISALKHTYQFRGLTGTLRIRTTEDETALLGYHCRGDMIVRISKVLAIPWSCYVCFCAEIGILSKEGLL